MAGGPRAGRRSLAVRAAKRLKRDGLFATEFSPTGLRMELDHVPLWGEGHVSIKQLLEDFARYIYLPRLKSPDLIVRAIEQGVGMLSWKQDSFAYAEGYDEREKRYRGLVAGQTYRIIVNDETLLVKPDIAELQLEEELKAAASAGEVTAPPSPSASEKPKEGEGEGSKPAPEEAPKPRRFYGSVALDPLRIGTHAGQIGEEVIQHLAALPSAEVEVTLEIQIKVPDGIPTDKRRTVTENCRTLGFDAQEFEEE